MKGNEKETANVMYYYDQQNRLVREDNYAINRSYVWYYDENDNIIMKRECTLATDGGHRYLLNTYYYTNEKR